MTVDMIKQRLPIIVFSSAMHPVASDLNPSIYPDISMVGLEVSFNVIARAPVDNCVTCMATGELAVAAPLLGITVRHRECLVFTWSSTSASILI